jgi:predicted CXXCH cytochrome family protein
MGGVMAGHHPQGTMSIALPEALSVHGASAGEQGNVMNCQSCHTPHGSAFDNLNVADPQTNDLCLPCHQELSPGRWTADSPGHHNTAKPIANPDHAEAIRNMGCRIGHDNQMICASCHQMHNANADHHLLGATLTDSQICIECHEQPAAMLNTAHDLRGSECDQPNLLGQTPTEAGPCSSCHAAHQQAREPFVQPGDPTGTCTTCHAEDRCAGKVSQTGISHPNTAASTCQSCHKPHDNMHEPFLQKRHDELCASCHAKQHSHLGGAHDFADRPDLTNAHGYHPERTGLCGFCHGIHNANGPSLWVATETPPKHPNDYCLSCHQAGGMAASHPTPPLLHPSGQATAGSPLNKNAKLPRYNEQLAHADEGMIACGTCHAVHGDSEQSPALIRNVAGADSLQMCLQCHESAKSIQTSLHAPEFIGRHAEVMSDHGSTEYCAPCHQVHHPDRTAEASKLENEPDAVARMWFAPTGDPKLPADLRQCLGCHSASGGAKQVNVVTHPAIPMQNIVEPSDPGYMPLADEKGTLGSGGRVTCRTCHLPHGRSFDNNKKAGEKETTPVRLRAKKPMIRRYADNSLCVNCHGAEGLHLYLYYHYPEKRR